MTLVNEGIFPGNKTVTNITASPQDISLKGLGGSSQLNANALSRIPETLSECSCYKAGNSPPENLPHGGYHYCTRAQKQ